MTSLANNYRPLVFRDIIGQEILVTTLTNAIKLSRVAHSFLLTGPHGIGKTSTARIIAKSLNCTSKTSFEPCMNCSDCLDITKSIHPDVLEMDAASNTSVDDIRIILENAKYLPSQAKVKIYIIDEVHMLSSSAFNALLKTIEHPSEYVKFILATTELNKVPATIISRCQRFSLQRISTDQLANYLEKISHEEKIKITQEAAMVIAKSACGSVRDAISILEQVILYTEYKDISAQDAQNVLGVSDQNIIFSLLSYILDRNPKKLLQLFSDLYNKGSDPLVILHELLEGFYSLSKIKILSGENNDLIKLVDKCSLELLNRLWQALFQGIQNVKIAPNIQAAAEIILLRLCYLSSLPSPSEIITKIQGGSNITSEEITKEQILSLCKKNGELLLYENLTNNLKIINIEESVIKLELIISTNFLEEIKKKLMYFLYLQLKKRYTLEVIDNTESYPIVDKIRENFDGVKITNMKKV